MTLIDVHSHYYMEEDETWIKELEEYNSICILNGINAKTNKQILNLKNKSNKIKIAFGIHPTEVDSIEDIEKEINFIKENKNNIVAIGEIGLDYYHTKNNAEKQKIVFIKLLELAEKLKLPVIIHARNSAKDVLDIISNFKMKKILHCYEASESNIKKAYEMDCYFTIPASVKRNEMFQKIVKLIPVSKMLTETDAPFQGPIKGISARPKDIKNSLEYISEMKNLDLKEVENMIFANYLRIF